MTGRTAAWCWIAAVVASSGCAPSIFQQHVDARRWTDAARVFAADSALQRDARVSFRAILLYSTPGTPVYDPTHARMLAERFLEWFPRSGDRAAAAHLVPLLRELERVEEMDRLERELRGQIVWLERRIELVRGSRDSLQARLAEEVSSHDASRRMIEQLEGELRLRDTQLRTLRTELDRLKAIDFRPPERPAATTPPPGDGATRPLPGVAASGSRRSRRRSSPSRCTRLRLRP